VEQNPRLLDSFIGCNVESPNTLADAVNWSDILVKRNLNSEQL
jgi:hypothetical protein